MKKDFRSRGFGMKSLYDFEQFAGTRSIPKGIMGEMRMARRKTKRRGKRSKAAWAKEHKYYNKGEKWEVRYGRKKPVKWRIRRMYRKRKSASGGRLLRGLQITFGR